MNKQFLFSLVWPITLFGGGSYYNMKANGSSLVPQSEIGLIERIMPVKITKPIAVGDDVGFKDGFEPTAETANFTIYAQKGLQNPAIIVDKDTGNVYMPKGVIAGGLYSDAGVLLIDEKGAWVGDKAGLKGDDCRIVGDADAKKIKCGSSEVPLSQLKGDKGDQGESCIQGSSIYPKCLDGIFSQDIFKVFMSETVSQDCKTIGGVNFQKKFTAQCPSAFPRIVAGSCESRSVSKNTIISSSEPFKSGDGFQCEVVSDDINDCNSHVVRVWATCTKAGVDYLDMPRD